MIKHNCPGSPDGRFPARVLGFAEPGEQWKDGFPTICYERTSTAVGMTCPQCGAVVPYVLTPVQAPIITASILPLFETMSFLIAMFFSVNAFAGAFCANTDIPCLQRLNKTVMKEAIKQERLEHGKNNQKDGGKSQQRSGDAPAR